MPAKLPFHVILLIRRAILLDLRALVVAQNLISSLSLVFGPNCNALNNHVEPERREIQGARILFHMVRTASEEPFFSNFQANTGFLPKFQKRLPHGLAQWIWPSAEAEE